MASAQSFAERVDIVATSPLATFAQQPAMPVVGFLHVGSPIPMTPQVDGPLVEAMQRRLRELDYSEGRDVAFEFRWAEGKLERLTQLATERVVEGIARD